MLEKLNHFTAKEIPRKWFILGIVVLGLLQLACDAWLLAPANNHSVVNANDIVRGTTPQPGELLQTYSTPTPETY